MLTAQRRFIAFGGISETSTKGIMDPGVRATVVTAGHCMHAELTSGLCQLTS